MQQAVVSVRRAVIDRFGEHVAPGEVGEQRLAVGPAGDLVARGGIEHFEHRRCEHEPEHVHGQQVDHFRVQVLRELVRRAAETGDRARLVVTAGEDARERNRGDQTFGALEQVGPIVFIEIQAQHLEQCVGLVGLAAKVGGRDLVEVTGEAEACDTRQRGERPPDEHHVEVRGTVDAQRVELGQGHRILEHVGAVEHDHGLVAEAGQSRGDRRVVGRGPRAGIASSARRRNRRTSLSSSSRASQTTGLVIARAHWATAVVLPLPAGPLTRVRRVASDAVIRVVS